MTPRYFGPQHDLSRVVKTHLFIICPNNSGSTFLKHALASSAYTWNLAREGQHTFGFVGPSSSKAELNRQWAATAESIAVFTDADAYDWPATRPAWYFQAFSASPDAHVFVEKSPPFLLVVDQLAAHFPDARFLFMVRNPYAVVEGILRKSRRAWLESVGADAALRIAAAHVVNCLAYQRRNIERWSRQGACFTYEEMCADPRRVERLIADQVPGLDDVNLRQRLRVHEYDEPLRNMNAQQVSRLGADQWKIIAGAFEPYGDLFEFFGYQLISPARNGERHHSW